MPYAEKFRKDDNLQRPMPEDLCIAAFASPTLLALADVLPAHVSGRSPYPPLMMFAAASAIRSWDSMEQGQKHLQLSHVWQQAVDAYARNTGNPGPYSPNAPTAAQIEKWYDRSASLFGADGLSDLADRFMDGALRLAVTLGQFEQGIERDFTNVDHRHIVMGDGTYVPPWSGAQYTEDPVTGDRILIGSRATVAKPRVATTVTDPTADDKTYRGLNQVTLSTWTDAGWIILGVRPALGAELHAALGLIDGFAARVGDGLHVVVWDRVLQGKVIAEILNKHGALVINKNVARERHQDTGSKRPRRRSAPAKTSPTRGSWPLLTHEQAVKRVKAGQPLPLGTSIYPTTKGHEMVRGNVQHYGPPPTLVGCAHDLWIDDGALVDVDFDAATGWRMKRAHAVATSSRLEPVPSGHRLVTTWALACVNEPDVSHEFTTVWDATQPLEGPGSRARKALAAMRPIPRLDEQRFRDIHGLRNITESINAWVKGRLFKTGKRAGHLHFEHQVLDHLVIAHLSNASTARRARLLGLIP